MQRPRRGLREGASASVGSSPRPSGLAPRSRSRPAPAGAQASRYTTCLYGADRALPGQISDRGILGRARPLEGQEGAFTRVGSSGLLSLHPVSPYEVPSRPRRRPGARARTPATGTWRWLRAPRGSGTENTASPASARGRLDGQNDATLSEVWHHCAGARARARCRAAGSGGTADKLRAGDPVPAHAHRRPTVGSGSPYPVGAARRTRHRPAPPGAGWTVRMMPHFRKCGIIAQVREPMRGALRRGSGGAEERLRPLTPCAVAAAAAAGWEHRPPTATLPRRGRDRATGSGARWARPRRGGQARSTGRRPNAAS